MAKITKLEKSILDLRQIEGYTIEETIKKSQNITKKHLKKLFLIFLNKDFMMKKK